MWDKMIDTLEDCFLKTFPYFLHATLLAHDANLLLRELCRLGMFVLWYTGTNLSI